ncbi:DNA primase, partial [Patescibacteria group bacterium]|nr:DNA primase [Patescibacteria group bacterium]
MQDSPIQQIKDRLDILEVVQSYLKLQKTGINYRALCPFHSEKKPSFFVSPTRQMWKCFGCSEGGDVFKFIMKIEGVEFGDALRILARKAGVELKPFRPELKTQRQRLYEISELSCRFFEKQLEGSSAGKEAKDYLLKRGLQEKSIKKWRIGYAPDTWQGLSDFLVGKGYQREEIVKAGMSVKSEKGQTPYDRFRGRIIFPIFDLNSQVIGFGGRVFKKSQDDEAVKYINIPNTLIYDKSQVLYGLNFAKMEVRKKDTCILAEGYLDVIFAHQAGFQNTVASSGTALTPAQLKIIKRYTSNLLTAFDMDVAGDLATKKGIDLAQRQDFEVKVISMPKDSDPADIISKDRENWKNLVARAKEIISFYFESAIGKFDRTTSQGKKQISKILLPKIKQIPNKISQAHWIQKLSKALKVPEEAIAEELKKILKKEEVREREAPEPEIEPPITQRQRSRKEILEERVLSLILKSPQNLNALAEDSLPIFSPKMKVILSSLKKEEVDDAEKMEKIL